MSLADLGALGSFISGVGVIVTVAYLAFQIHQNTRALRASMQQSQTDGHAQYLLQLAESDLIVAIGGKIMRGEPLDEIEQMRRRYLLSAVFLQLQTAYYIESLGVGLHAGWLNQERALVRWLSAPGVREWWREDRDSFAVEFRALVDGKVGELEEASSRAARRTKSIQGQLGPDMM